jgi:hypothetical protein
MAGSKLKNAAATGAAATAPSGADRAAKYPAQNPFNPASRNDWRAAGAK